MSPETKTVWKRLIEIVENSTDFPEGITNRKFATAGLPMGNTKQKNGLGNDAYLNKWQWCNLNINYTRNSISIPMLIGSTNERVFSHFRKVDRLNIRKWKASITWFYEKRYHITGATFSQSIYILCAPTGISVISISIQNHQNRNRHKEWN